MTNAERRYVLNPRPPVRAFVTAAVLLLVGALLTALFSSNDAAAFWVVLGALVMVAGGALAALAGISMVKMRTYVTLDDKGYRITGPGVDKQGSWDEVNKVTTSAGGSHLTLYHGAVARTHLICPGGGDDEQMKALVADMAKRLDANRGYGETFMIPVMNPHEPQDPSVVQHQA